jgi:hypothetical protein
MPTPSLAEVAFDRATLCAELIKNLPPARTPSEQNIVVSIGIAVNEIVKMAERRMTATDAEAHRRQQQRTAFEIAGILPTQRG